MSDQNVTASKSVMVVGNCLPDNFTMGRWFKKHFDADYLKARNRVAAIEMLRKHSIDLVLVNRIFDSDGGSGIDLIAELTRDFSATTTMLISNFADAQTDAEAQGALPGFGKSELKNPASVDKVKHALG